MSARDLAKQRATSDERREWMLHQVATGELVIRQATPEERSRYRIAGPAVPARRRRRKAVAQRAGEGGLSKAA